MKFVYNFGTMIFWDVKYLYVRVTYIMHLFTVLIWCMHLVDTIARAIASVYVRIIITYKT